MKQDETLNGNPEVTPETNENETMSMEALLAQEEFSLNVPRKGEVRTGMIASVNGDEILVSIGAKSEGIIPSNEISQLSADEKASLKVGNEIKVLIVSPENKQGTVLLSYTRAREEEDWVEAENLMNENKDYESKVVGYNKGGILVGLGSLRGFVPASQVSLLRRAEQTGQTPEDRWGSMVGEPITVRVIEVDRFRRRLIMSERAAASESRDEIKSKLITMLEIGETYKGRVTSMANFGAFININGVDGLVHLSELSWEHVNHPKDILKIGQEVNAKVINIDEETKRVGLSIRLTEKDPWMEKISEYRNGQLVEGEITRLTKFGAFAKVEDNLEGLIHVSELSDARVEHPKEILAVGDKLTLRIIKIDKEQRRLGLSLRKVDSLAYNDLDWQIALEDVDGINVTPAATEEENESPEAEA
jgi:small subunit ribosomal protein S1